ncbi:MAG: hypothetical protein A2075_08260 [Geobacteraceae bacterium GWC2_58_44]|nr:MAG: hypothetical protein A2075_08260 [Geobacteraceae bacterium GWC2_58_44]
MRQHGGNSLNLLLFSVEGIDFGIDAEQALGTAAYDGEEAPGLLWFHEELELPTASAVYLTPAIVTVGTRGGGEYRVIIDAMQEITEFYLNELRPLPAIIEPFAMRKGIWGVLPRNGRLTLLLDFVSLFGRREAALFPPPGLPPPGGGELVEAGEDG